MECRMRRHTHTTWATTPLYVWNEDHSVVCSCMEDFRFLLIRAHGESTALSWCAVFVCIGYAHYCYGFHWMSAECKEDAFPFVFGFFSLFYCCIESKWKNRTSCGLFTTWILCMWRHNATTIYSSFILCVMPQCLMHRHTHVLMYIVPYWKKVSTSRHVRFAGYVISIFGSTEFG